MLTHDSPGPRRRAPQAAPTTRHETDVLAAIRSCDGATFAFTAHPLGAAVSASVSACPTCGLSVHPVARLDCAGCAR